jgi:WD40 repeat protein
MRSGGAMHPAVMIAFTLCLSLATSCARRDNRIASDLKKELAARSRDGLALVTLVPNEKGLPVDFFDGRSRRLFPNCCRGARALSVSRNRLLVLDDLPSPLILNPERDPTGSAGSPLINRPVVMFDVNGHVITQSKARLWPLSVSLSPGQERVALISLIRGSDVAGLYLIDLRDEQERKLLSLHNTTYANGGFSADSMVDWSPSGDFLLLSHQGTISEIDARTGQSRMIASGSSALWSPSREWISYRTLDWRPALLKIGNLQTKLLDPWRKGASTLEWSPDGRYLLVPEVDPEEAPEFNHDALWVYRISDGVWERFPYDVRFYSWHWLQLKN